MDKKPAKNRVSVMPLMLAMLISVVSLPALNIFRINARGVGDIAVTPKTKASLGQRLLQLQAHPAFRPVMAAMAMLIAYVTGHHGMALGAAVLGTLTEGSHAAEAIVYEVSQFLSRDSVTVLSGQNLSANAVVGRKKYGIGRVSIPTVVTEGTSNGTVSGVFAGPEVEVGSYVATCTAAAANAGTFSVTTPSGKALPAATVGVAYTSRHINFTIADGSNDYVVGDSFTFVVDGTAPTVIGGTGTGVMTALSLGPDAKPGRYQVINRAVVANGGDFEVIAPDGTSVGRFLMGTSSAGTAAFTSRQVNFTLSDATDYILGNYFDICVYNELAGGKVVAWDPTTFDGRHRVAGVLVSAIDATSADKAGVVVARNAAVVKTALSWGASITASQKESAYAELAARHVIALDGVTV